MRCRKDSGNNIKNNRRVDLIADAKVEVGLTMPPDYISLGESNSYYLAGTYYPRYFFLF
jgi:hypothetical protein